MAWIRLSDDYTDHPKFDNLSDGAFRLWHQAMGFCRKFQTDGLIPIASLKKLKAFTVKRKAELMTPWREGENPLWWPVEGFGVKVHDYLQWNPSKDEENERRQESKDRMRTIREGRKAVCLPPVRANSEQTTHDVLGWDGKEALEEMRTLSPIVRGATRMAPAPDPNIAQRAGQLVERYGELFYQHRRGARLKPAPALDFQRACDLVTTWTDDARLEKLAVIVLTTDDTWIANTGRGFAIFAAKASWADDRLAAWEAAQTRTA